MSNKVVDYNGFYIVQ